MAALVERGIDASKLMAGGAGQTQPIASNETGAISSFNRRAEQVRITDMAEAKKLVKGIADSLATETN